MKIPKGTTFKNSCEKILDLIKDHKNSWPFKEAVKKEEVPDYHDLIKNPIDLGIITLKLKGDKYKTKKHF